MPSVGPNDKRTARTGKRNDKAQSQRVKLGGFLISNSLYYRAVSSQEGKAG
jgi:hypothetical protein